MTEINFKGELVTDRDEFERRVIEAFESADAKPLREKHGCRSGKPKPTPGVEPDTQED